MHLFYFGLLWFFFFFDQAFKVLFVIETCGKQTLTVGSTVCWRIVPALIFLIHFCFSEFCYPFFFRWKSEHVLMDLRQLHVSDWPCLMLWCHINVGTVGTKVNVPLVLLYSALYKMFYSTSGIFLSMEKKKIRLSSWHHSYKWSLIVLDRGCTRIAHWFYWKMTFCFVV